MITIDKLEQKIEKLMEQVRSLSFAFKNPDLQKDAEDARDEAVDLLESYCELATQDWEEQSENVDESDELS
jgi:hypothetical protein